MVDIKYLEKLSYPDFVGFINQWNVLPGAYTTISKWIVFSKITEKSHILQFACTTGFQSREISMLTGCTGDAFDLSEQAIKMARYNQDMFASNSKINYFQADGLKLKAEPKYTHVLIGAGFQFFRNPAMAINRTLEFLKDDGFLLTSPFYIEGKIPDYLIQEFKSIFGIAPTIYDYKTVMRYFKGLEIIYEDRNILIPETEEELEHYCTSITDRACDIHNITDASIRQYIYDRLYKIKDMSNKLRPYQRYSVLVLRKRKGIYPDRLVELF